LPGPDWAGGCVCAEAAVAESNAAHIITIERFILSPPIGKL
jgi:hypothetical protein